MQSIEELKKERIFHYFYEISQIPRGSHHTNAICQYLEEFAKAQGLSYVRDDHNNVIIYKEATKGHESAPTIILQGHTDMVLEKTKSCKKDLLREGLDLETDGTWLYAKDTTLGGDDGVAVAYALAILESDEIAHPNLEVVLTSDEEVGLLGASALDVSLLKGRYLLNMDNEQEDEMIVGCAGGLVINSHIPVRYMEVSGLECEISIEGLKGGHSGSDISKYRANANVLMGRLLHELKEEVDFVITELTGGDKDNVIAYSSSVKFFIDSENVDQLEAFTKKIEGIFAKEYKNIEENLSVSCEILGENTAPALNPASTQKVIFYLMFASNGVEKMSGEIEGLVETSANLASIRLLPTEFKGCVNIRSSIGSAKQAVAEKISYLTEFLGGSIEREGEYSAWEYQSESKFRDYAVGIYQEVFGREAKIEVIHAGLECGLFIEKNPEIDCISIGPDLCDIHSVKERLHIESARRCFSYVCKILENWK